MLLGLPELLFFLSHLFLPFLLNSSRYHVPSQFGRVCDSPPSHPGRARLACSGLLSRLCLFSAAALSLGNKGKLLIARENRRATEGAGPGTLERADDLAAREAIRGNSKEGVFSS